MALYGEKARLLCTEGVAYSYAKCNSSQVKVTDDKEPTVTQYRPSDSNQPYTCVPACGIPAHQLTCSQHEDCVMWSLFFIA